MVIHLCIFHHFNKIYYFLHLRDSKHSSLTIFSTFFISTRAKEWEGMTIFVENKKYQFNSYFVFDFGAKFSIDDQFQQMMGGERLARAFFRLKNNVI